MTVLQASREACLFRITGHVQGVGFRPFVYRLAQQHHLHGWVRNTTGCVEIHVEGDPTAMESFSHALIHQAPAIALPRINQATPVAVERFRDFRILPSARSEAHIHLPTDYFVCADCLREMHDQANRRYRYPFINCTQCGPRYTLIESLPYDRSRTTMRKFTLCDDCTREYHDPQNRRFHAEPIACPACGPHLALTQANQVDITDTTNTLEAAVALLRTGAILAVKGIGGYHLMCDARNEAAVARLRERKSRPTKPLAVMFPANTHDLHEAVHVDAEALALLQSPQRPILLLEKRHPDSLAPNIAPGLNEIGCLLPYSPLHVLLVQDFAGPLVATSGNLQGEPVIIDNVESQKRLCNVADAFLHHDRPIARPADDCVYRTVAGRPRPLRLGRGNAPLELELPNALPVPVLALGAHTKNTIALAWGRRMVLSPHIADLSSVKCQEIQAQIAEDLQHLYQVRATRLLVDRHPHYGYRSFVRTSGLPTFEVTHHHAHAAALAWELPEVQNWITFTWDGVGLGEDGTLWGGEVFTGTPGQWSHAASFRPFHLPGGEQAGRAPWRSAAALLWETGQAAPFAPDLLQTAWAKRINAPQTSAVGRLFDAAAALTGLCTETSFEGEGPMQLEAAASQYHAPVAPITLPLDATETGLWRSDWAPLLNMLQDNRQAVEARAAQFHLSLSHALLEQAVLLNKDTGAIDVGLTGGVFQNRLLCEMTQTLLTQAGFRVHIPTRLPVNDACISIGQVMEFLFAQPAS